MIKLTKNVFWSLLAGAVLALIVYLAAPAPRANAQITPPFGPIPIAAVRGDNKGPATVPTTTLFTTPNDGIAHWYQVDIATYCTTQVATATAQAEIIYTDQSGTAQSAGNTATCTTLGGSSRVGLVSEVQPQPNSLIRYNVIAANSPTFNYAINVWQIQ